MPGSRPLAPQGGEPSPPAEPAPARDLHQRRRSSTEARSLVRTWLPVLVWAAVIFGFSSIPSLGTGLGVWDTILRKGAHTTEYAILGALLYRALLRPWPAFAAGVLYSASDELHQHFVRGRHASPVDVAIDAIGVALGLALLHRVRR